MDRLWWMHITKAHKFKEDIVNAAAGGRSVVLSLPQNTPWKNTLKELVEDRLRMENPKNRMEEFRCPEEDVGAFLLRKYVRKERRANYRYGMTYAAFLGKCEDTVLNDRYIWVTDVSQKKLEEWLGFIAEYNKNVDTKTPAIFILETQEGTLSKKARKGITNLVFDQNISAYDKFTFCALATTENACKEYIRPYLAELVSTICNEDIELCAECVAAGNAFLKNPAKTIADIAENSYRSDGERFTFSRTEEEMKTLIWETQLKNVFPVIEKYRSQFIKKYSQQIKNGLPITNAFDEVVDTPEDVEIGTLVLMAGKGKLVLNERDYQELITFWNARNSLAHLGTLDPESAERLLKRGTSL